ncbi:MAG: UDP-N-acetylmuramate dehydrogenase [Clostridia bacterium]|nr:UDP-N-acetylmuramate dehydrogenase [Clostridia bacterium]
MSSYDIIRSVFDSIGCDYNENTFLSACTSFRIGGKADFFAVPDSVEMLSAIITSCRKNCVRYFILGKGSNILVSDDGFRGVVISTSGLDKIELIDETTIYCQSGVTLSKLCRFALDHSLTGLEFAFGIPGSAGGAAYMNAGAYNGEMKDVLYKCEHISSDGQIGYYEEEDLDLSYRHSVYSKSDKVITALYIKLQKCEKDVIKSRMDELMCKRRNKQPLEFPSAGSTFKRPEGHFAGKLVEDCGLKGYTVGGAQVSEKHAGFVINIGNATASDVLGVIEHCQKTVMNATGIMLEPEVEIIG